MSMNQIYATICYEISLRKYMILDQRIWDLEHWSYAE